MADGRDRRLVSPLNDVREPVAVVLDERVVAVIEAVRPVRSGPRRAKTWRSVIIKPSAHGLNRIGLEFIGTGWEGAEGDTKAPIKTKTVSAVLPAREGGIAGAQEAGFCFQRKHWTERELSLFGGPFSRKHEGCSDELRPLLRGKRLPPERGPSACFANPRDDTR